MAVQVRVVDVDGEQDELLEILERNLADLPHARRFKWLYRGHPLGLPGLGLRGTPRFAASWVSPRSSGGRCGSTDGSS